MANETLIATPLVLGRPNEARPALAPAATFRSTTTKVKTPNVQGQDGNVEEQDALAAGVKVTGWTAHVATLEVDDGPILAQEAVGVLDGDTVETLHPSWPGAGACVLRSRPGPRRAVTRPARALG